MNFDRLYNNNICKDLGAGYYQIREFDFINRSRHWFELRMMLLMSVYSTPS